MHIYNVTTFSLVLILCSCDSGDKIRTYRLPKSEVQPEEQSNSHQTMGFKWKKPTNWIPSSGSSMRLASFDVPYKGGTGDFSLILLPGDGGGLVPNINRWRGQLGLEPQSLHEIENSMLYQEGELGGYKIINIVNNQNNSAFLIAIIPLGKQTLFAKLSIDISGVEELESDFIDFCSSIHFTQ